MDEEFLTPEGAGIDRYLEAMSQAAALVARSVGTGVGPTSGSGLAELRRRFEDLEVCPEGGVALAEALAEVGQLVLGDMVVVSHPRYAAHLHSPPAISSLAAEVVIAATNQSVDSFDSGPSAAALEERVIAWACRLVGFGPRGDGVFTTGGTASNLMALLLARDHWAMRDLGWSVRNLGLPAGAGDLRIVASERSHFSIARAAHVLGLGRSALVEVPTTPSGGLDAALLEERLAAEVERGRRPFVVVLTAGTTDTGAVDPLAEAADIAHRRGLWVHVDAAAAGALLLSSRHRWLLEGIERADSVSIDFHKLFCQSIPSSIVLVADGAGFRHLRTPVPYLDPVEDAEADVVNLVGKSLQTTRRFDALKALVTLRTLGRARIAAMVDALVGLAAHAAEHVRRAEDLELVQAPVTNTTLFRWRPAAGADEADLEWVNQRLHHELWRRGAMVVGRTRQRGQACLKLTFCNPACDEATVEGMLDELVAAGHALLRQRQAVPSAMG